MSSSIPSKTVVKQILHVIVNVVGDRGTQGCFCTAADVHPARAALFEKSREVLGIVVKVLDDERPADGGPPDRRRCCCFTPRVEVTDVMILVLVVGGLVKVELWVVSAVVHVVTHVGKNTVAGTGGGAAGGPYSLSSVLCFLSPSPRQRLRRGLRGRSRRRDLHDVAVVVVLHCRVAVVKTSE